LHVAVGLLDAAVVGGRGIDTGSTNDDVRVTVAPAAGDWTTCLNVDRVDGTAALNPYDIQQLAQTSPNESAPDALSAFARGTMAVGGESFCLLDLDALLRSLALS